MQLGKFRGKFLQNKSYSAASEKRTSMHRVNGRNTCPRIEKAERGGTEQSNPHHPKGILLHRAGRRGGGDEWMVGTGKPAFEGVARQASPIPTVKVGIVFPALPLGCNPLAF